MESSDHTKALRILFDTYWSASGWKRQRVTSPEDFEFARIAGIMFEPIALDHDGEIKRVVRAREQLSPLRVAQGFLASLGARRLDLRSALGTYAVARHLPIHRYMAVDGSLTCAICGRINRVAQTHDLNVLSFERFKWGGVRHTDPMYIAFDLEQFLLADIPVPATQDLLLLKAILAAIETAPAYSKLSAIEKSLAVVLKGNSAERRTLLGILGYAGILQPNGRAGFLDGFTRWCDRAERPLNKDDWPYPIRWWTPRDGVNQPAVDWWFPGITEA